MGDWHFSAAVRLSGLYCTPWVSPANLLDPQLPQAFGQMDVAMPALPPFHSLVVPLAVPATSELIQQISNGFMSSVI